MSRQPCSTVVLISGSGSNLQAFIDAAARAGCDYRLSLVVSNVSEAYGLVRAEQASIPAVCVEHGDYPDRRSFERAMAAHIDRAGAELLILAGFMRILSPWFVEHYRGRMLNIHPALLPAYPGLDTHRRVLDAAEPWHGSTVHFVTEELDAGPRILQGRLPVDPAESAATLARRVQAVEHRIYPQAAALFASGRLRCHDGKAFLDDKWLEEPLCRSFDAAGRPDDAPG